MNIPPFLLGAALLFSGWLTGSFVLGVICGLLIEAPRLIDWRVEISRREFAFVWNLCVVLFIGIAVLFALTEPSKAVVASIRWAPVVMLPMMAAMAYSTTGKVDLDILSIISRNTVRREGEVGRKRVTLAHPFLVLCIMSSATASDRTPWFYAGSVVFLAWALWGVRSRSVSLFSWLVLIIMSTALGYAGHIGLHSLQGKVEQALSDWYTSDRTDEQEANPRYSAIGGVGFRKLSNRINLRVELLHRTDAPMLLREAVYNSYRVQTWHAANNPEIRVQPDHIGTWRIGMDQSTGQPITIHASLGTGVKVLPLPSDAARIEKLPAAAVLRSELGTVKVEDGPGVAEYQVVSNPNVSLMDKPTDKDTAVPDNEAAVLRKMAIDLGLSSLEPAKAMDALTLFFSNNFQYALVKPGEQGVMPFLEFLLLKRAGHCEYFATATVLLLRAAGIPARYVVGYSVQEYSNLEQMFVVRSRHAHAWSLVYLDGAWRDFDTTPPSWAEIENTQSPVIGYIHDIWQKAVFSFSQLHYGFSATGLRSASIWTVSVLILFLSGGIYRRRRVRDNRQGNGLKARLCPGHDSEFFAVEKILEERGYLRQPWEPTSIWLEKIQTQRVFSLEQRSHLSNLFEVHNRYRFDPNGITPEEREMLKVTAGTWQELEQNKRTS